MSTTNINQHGGVPAVAVAGNSPTVADVPFWVTACVRLMPPTNRRGKPVSATLANAVIVAAQALLADRLRGTSETEVPLDKARIARRCGLQPDKAGWLFDYLQRIGFLRITRHYSTPGRGRQHDTFTVYNEAPLNYVGPRTHAELERALDDPNRPLVSVLFVGETPGQPESAESSAIESEQSAESSALLGETPGQPESAESSAIESEQSAESSALLGETPGQPESAESSAIPPRALRSDLSSLRSERDRREERESEPDGGREEAPATGSEDDDAATAARRLVRRLPWHKWNEHTGRTFTLTQTDADRLTTVIAEAIRAGRVTSEQAEQVAPAALTEATASPVSYLIGAFKGNKLTHRVRSMQAAELDDDPLPFPTPAHQPDTEPPHETPRAVPSLPACGRCRADAGAALYKRTVLADPLDANSPELPCPDCHPDTTDVA